MAYAFYTSVQEVRPHSMADKLDIATVFGMDTIVLKDTWKKGDHCIYFATGGVISSLFLKENNLYRNSTLNSNVQLKGYFEENGRVKAMKLRGEMSDGIIMPLSSLKFWVSEKELSNLVEDQEIEKIGNFTLVSRYLVVKKGTQKGTVLKKAKVNYIPEHLSTAQFNYNLNKFSEGCLVNISYKLHGTSGRFAHLNRPWWKFWVPKFVSGSRRVEFKSFNKSGFYDNNDFRKHYHDKLSKIVPKGYTLYFEIVGWVDDSTPIMPIYNTNKLEESLQAEFGPRMIFSYGCKQGEHKMYVYRVTHNDKELDPSEIYYFCDKLGLETVPKYDTLNAWRSIQNVKNLESIIQKEFINYRDRIDSSHLLEGIVIRVQNKLSNWEAYKIKTNEFKIIDDIENSGMKPENFSDDMLEEM